MHDASPAGLALAERTLAAWRHIDAALSAAEASQNRSRQWLLIRAATRAVATVIGGAAMIATTYVAAILLLLPSA